MKVETRNEDYNNPCPIVIILSIISAITTYLFIKYDLLIELLPLTMLDFFMIFSVILIILEPKEKVIVELVSKEEKEYHDNKIHYMILKEDDSQKYKCFTYEDNDLVVGEKYILTIIKYQDVPVRIDKIKES